MTPYAMNSCMHLMKEREKVEKEGGERRGEGRGRERMKDRREETGGQRVTATYSPIRKTTFCHWPGYELAQKEV